MTDRRAHGWGAAIVAAGGLLATAAALSAGRPGSLWRPFAVGVLAYGASGALVLRWGFAVYGPRGALAAVALYAFTPGVLAALAAPPLLAPAGATTLAGSFAQLAAAYALMRCLLDPTLARALLASAAILAAPIGAFLQGAWATVLAGLGVLSVALILSRIATAERCEPRARLVRASVASIALAWGVALAIVLLTAAASHLPSPQEYSDVQRSALSVQRSAFAVSPFRAAAASGSELGSERSTLNAERRSPNGLPIAALLLAAVRPWRRQRRYTDAGWVAALLCLSVPLWLVWGQAGGVFMAPVAALLAGACWDESRPPRARYVATVVVLVQVAAAVALWPHYPGGVRAGAWLPMPGISTDGGLGAAP
jgi:hypothetical protein